MIVPSSTTHSGEKTTTVVVSRRYYWPHMKKEMFHFVKTYVKFLIKRASYQKQADLLQLLPILPKAWHSMFMDFINNLPKLQGQDAIFVMIDQFSKLAHMVLIVGTTTSFETTKLLLNAW